ncbi:MAG: RIP metalloprotease RseP [Clostridiales bacterium]|nr:RIP metalloprotease RseP [Clostridiales bacterium]
MSPLSIVICILGLGVLAAVHEIGHFIVARLLKIKVYELSIFVGPKLFSWKRKDIEYYIRLIPLGAYVRFSEIDEDTGELKDDNPENLINQARWKRLLVSLAGPAMNVILGIIIFMICFSKFGFLELKQDIVLEGTQVAETRIEEGDRILKFNGQKVYCQMDLSYYLGKVSNVDEVTLQMKSAKTGEKYEVVLKPEVTEQYMLGITHYAGLDENGGWKIISVDAQQNEGNPVIKPGDSVLTVNDVPVSDPSISDLVRNSKGETLSVRLIRNGEEMTLQLKATMIKSANLRGIYLQDGEGFFACLHEAVVFPVAFIRISIDAIAQVFTGSVPAYDVVSGPVGIASVVSDVVDSKDTDSSEKIEMLLILLGGISVGLAFTNMLPIPGLDGNAIVLTVVEMIRGKKLSRKSEQIINVIGFIMIIGLVIFALVSDIIRLSR